MNLKKEICPCYHVTKGDIVKAFAEGTTSYKDIKKATKSGKACGKYKKKAKSL